jgi:hypothetical protein
MEEEVKEANTKVDEPLLSSPEVLQLADNLEHSLAFTPEDTVDQTSSHALLTLEKKKQAKNKLMYRTLDEPMATHVVPHRVQERRDKFLNKFSPASYLKHLECHREARRKKGFEERLA